VTPTLPNPSGIIGHARVKHTLSEQVAHSILLCGPARVGRRGLARWWAQRLNCSRPNGLEPCGICASCQNFAAGTHPDYLEISPKTETSTGKKARSSIIPIKAISSSHDPDHDYELHVMDWLETSARYRHKVVVFDGAEFLNEAAANALLKIVEEPPHRARFAFIAEDVSGVMPTITSRSVQIRVPPVSSIDLENAWLEHHEQLETELLEFASGRPGLILNAEHSRDCLSAAKDFWTAVRGDLLNALSAADALEKGFDRDLTPDALRFTLRGEAPSVRVRADTALERALEALERYATPSLVFMVLTLECRAAFGVSR
jgi:DNA polymerase III subunit delta'